MKSLVSLALLAVVILCCVHSGVAGKDGGKCLNKRETRSSRDICDGSRSMLIAYSKLGRTARGKEKFQSLAFISVLCLRV